MTTPARPLAIAGKRIRRGESCDIRLKISETYTGDAVNIPIRVIRARQPGPVVFVTAAIHGDEINGTGIIHDLMFDAAVHLLNGSLILVPVVNVFGFESHDRYLPDRRDLNRAFPGSKDGSLAARVAHTLMQSIVAVSDFGIDLHSAAAQRTNFPNVRGDLSIPEVRRLAQAFGCALIVDGKGPVGSFRREACKAGCPTIILEGGEPNKIEPSVLETGCTGVRNVLIDLGMLNGDPVRPPYQVRIARTTWLRARVGGILRFHVTPGAIVKAGDAIATNFSLLGQQQNSLTAPADGIVLSITTLPAVKPGEPVCHLAIPSAQISRLQRSLKSHKHSAYHQAHDHLATNVHVVPPDPPPP